MSALTEQEIDDALEAMGGFVPDEHYPEYGHESLREAYRIGYEVTEKAVRASVAAEIERAAVMETCSCPSCDCGGTNHDRLSGLYDAARIAEGKQP